MITAACVLRSGGDFGPEWVYALKRGLNRHLPEHRFVCLTDVVSIPPMWAMPLLHGWPGWWSKMELFRPNLFAPGERVLYMDLDTLPVGDLSDLASYGGKLAMISGFYRREKKQSGVMVWTVGPRTEGIWSRWIASPKKHMVEYRGDGEWLHAHTEADRLQNLYPGQLVSLKRGAQDRIPDGARLVCGHGRPRLSKPAAGWAHEEWLRRKATMDAVEVAGC